jgi:GNAT superfamily N-acetyltransferase
MIRIVRAKPKDAGALTEIAHAANSAFIAIDDGSAVGFYVLTTEDDGIHLDNLWIVRAAMRRRIGRALFEHAAAEARNLGFNSIRIGADPNAEEFYKRRGAIRVGARVSNVEGEQRTLLLLEFRLAKST